MFKKLKGNHLKKPRINRTSPFLEASLALSKPPYKNKVRINFHYQYFQNRKETNFQASFINYRADSDH